MILAECAPPQPSAPLKPWIRDVTWSTIRANALVKKQCRWVQRRAAALRMRMVLALRAAAALSSSRRSDCAVGRATRDAVELGRCDYSRVFLVRFAAAAHKRLRSLARAHKAEWPVQQTAAVGRDLEAGSSRSLWQLARRASGRKRRSLAAVVLYGLDGEKLGDSKEVASAWEVTFLKEFGGNGGLLEVGQSSADIGFSAFVLPVGAMPWS